MRIVLGAMLALAPWISAPAASAQCSPAYTIDTPKPPAEGDRLGAVLYLGKRVPGIDVRGKTSEAERMGLWYGIWFQTRFQLRTGRNFYRCWDGQQAAPRGRPSPQWMTTNHELTWRPYEVYRNQIERGAACGGEAKARAACEAWVRYFRAAAQYATDVAAGRYDGVLKRLSKVSAERENQRLLWHAHTAAMAVVAGRPPDTQLPEGERRFLQGWTKVVHYLDRTNFPTTSAFIQTFGRTMPRCYPLGGPGCEVKLDASERTGLSALQLGFARAMIAYENLSATTIARLLAGR